MLFTLPHCAKQWTTGENQAEHSEHGQRGCAGFCGQVLLNESAFRPKKKQGEGFFFLHFSLETNPSSLLIIFKGTLKLLNTRHHARQGHVKS